MTLCSDRITDFKMELHNNDRDQNDKSSVSYLTLAVLPRRPPQKGLKILDIDSTPLWAAILLYYLVAACTSRRFCARAIFLNKKNSFTYGVEDFAIIRQSLESCDCLTIKSSDQIQSKTNFGHVNLHAQTQ